jgi:hypothetical protein
MPVRSSPRRGHHDDLRAVGADLVTVVVLGAAGVRDEADDAEREEYPSTARSGMEAVDEGLETSPQTQRTTRCRGVDRQRRDAYVEPQGIR